MLCLHMTDNFAKSWFELYVKHANKMPKITQFDRPNERFCSTKVIFKELLANNLAYLNMACSEALEKLKKRDMWRTKENVVALKNNL